MRFVAVMVASFFLASYGSAERVSRAQSGTAPCPDKAWRVLVIGGEIQPNSWCSGSTSTTGPSKTKSNNGRHLGWTKSFKETRDEENHKASEREKARADKAKADKERRDQEDKDRRAKEKEKKDKEVADKKASDAKRERDKADRDSRCHGKSQKKDLTECHRS
jgi:hypothetical protein